MSKKIAPLHSDFYARACWRDVRIYLRVIDAKSTRQGAKDARVALNTARSAVFRLERLCRCGLVVRGVPGITPTDEGNRLADIAREIEQVLENARLVDGQSFIDARPDVPLVA